MTESKRSIESGTSLSTTGNNMKVEHLLTIHRTPNPNCPACQEHRWHKEPEWDAFHPDRGQGSVSDIRVLRKKESK